jgi:polyhydroxyalkanoate synthesis regulator phasin
LLSRIAGCTADQKQENGMVKKLKAQAKEEDQLFADAVRISAQQIWQAGLGAFAKAQEQGEGGGGQVFHTLVREGTQMQQRGGAAPDDGVSARAAGSWDTLERVFEERVGRALGAIGVPTREDVAALTLQVEQLTRMVEQLSGGQGAANPAESGKSAAKTAQKTAAARKPAATKAGAAPGGGD